MAMNTPGTGLTTLKASFQVVDYNDGTYTYYGKAPWGTPLTSAAWQVFRLRNADAIPATSYLMQFAGNDAKAIWPANNMPGLNWTTP